MKKITYLFVLVFALFTVNQSFSQKVAVIGMNHTSPDGITFVVTQTLGSSEVVYFSEDEYNNVTNVFASGESVVTYTADATGLAVGQVVFLKETSSNVLTTTCSQGFNCGSAVVSTVNFALGSGGESMYAYSDTDADPTNGVTEIYSVMYTIAGSIPGGESPVTDYPTAIVVDGFASGAPDRTEFNAGRDGVSQVTLENPANYTNGSSNADLSLTAFTNLNLAGANPVLTVTSSPSSVTENGVTNIVYTFMLDANATSSITVNFSVGGSATFSTDYTQSGANSFNASTGTVTISNGTNSAVVTINPSGDSTFEPDETVSLTISAGTGYDAGTPSLATSTITNDDTKSITPVVAVTGTNQTPTEGFSFVALDDITAGTVVYFTENEFNKNSLAFNTGESIVSWTAPAGGVLRGEVIVAKETAANVFTTSCNSGTCGTVSSVSGNFALANNGESFYAYSDTDAVPSNGITDLFSVLFTGTSVTPGGNIPAVEDPSGVYIGSVVVDGFPAVAPNRTEYKFVAPARSITVDLADFQNTSNWLHAQTNQDLSTVPFANIIVATGSANPVATVSLSPTSVLEDSGTGMVFTFTLDAPAVGAITVNFTVGGNATFTTDYTVSGSASFNASTGSVTIADTATSANVTVTPVIDTTVEVQETVQLQIASGTGYDGGSPNSATATITNDDTSLSDPLVAITGLNHLDPDGFSFVAAKTIPAGTDVYFTEDEFDNTTLLFSSGEAVLKWTAPAGGIPTGDVIVINETAENVFSLTCNGASGAACGIIALISGTLATASNGETFYAYEDDDNDPTNGVIDIYAVLYTGDAGTPGGIIPAAEDPSGIYLSALVVDGFPAVAPNRTEYDPTKRGVPVNQADFENVANWIHAQTNAALSPVPFAALSIVDSTPPMAECKDITVQLDGTGSANIVGSDVDNGSSDNIMVASLSVSPDTFDCSDIGPPVQVTLTVADAAGNMATCMAYVTVEDNIDPVLANLPGDQLNVDMDTDACGATITFSDPTVTDNCDNTVTVVRTDATGLDSGDLFPEGSTVISYSSTDADNNVGTHSFEVTVNADGEDPVLANLPGDQLNVPMDAGMCGAVITFSDPTVTDNCDNTVTVVRTDATGLDSGDLFPEGSTVISYSSTDADNNVGTHSFEVTVNADGEDPVLANLPGDQLNVPMDAGMCGAVITFSDPTVTDNCDNTITVVRTDATGLNSGDLFPEGSTVISYSSTDADNNVGTHSFEVTVNADGEDPVLANLPGDQLNVPMDAGMCGAVITFSDPTVTDNCDNTVTVVRTDATGLNSGDLFPEGSTVISYSSTDADNNVGTHSFEVTVNADGEDPVLANLPGDQLNVPMDAGMCGAVITFSDPTVTDNCDNTITVVRTDATGLNSGDLFPEGSTVISYSSTDADNNVGTHSFEVTVNADGEDPVLANLPGDQLNVPMDAGMCGAVITFSDPTVTDNCDNTVTVVRTDATGLNSGDLFPEGSTVISYSSTDADNNVGTHSFEVTVNADGEDPVLANLPGDQLNVPMDAGMCGAVITFSDPTVTDNCDNTVTVVRTDATGLNSGDLFPEGSTVISYSSTDADNNVGTHSFEVTVNADGEDPVLANLPGDQLNVPMDAGMCGAVITFSDPTVTDNCDNTVTVVRTDATGLNSGDLFPEGSTVISYSSTDADNNVGTHSFEVTVNADGEDPTITCSGDATADTSDNGIGNCTTTASLGIPTTDDNCGVKSVVAQVGGADINPVTYEFGVGETIVTWIVTDDSDNTASCDQKVTVADNENPTITCMADIIINNTPGSCNGSVTLIDPIFSDNCPGASVSNDAPATFPFGTTEFTWTVTDASNNTATCKQKVTINQIQTTSSVTVTQSTQQYSDLVKFDASLSPGSCVGAGNAATTVTFMVGAQEVGTVNLVLNVGTNTLEGTLTAPLLETQVLPSPPNPFLPNGQMAPGVHTVTAVFGGKNSNFIISDPTTNLTITQEDALVDYTGQNLQATAGSNPDQATVILSANVQDINDGNRGDIRNATLTFVDRDNGDNVIAGPFQISDLVNPGDTTLGTVSWPWNVDIGSATSETFHIGFIVNGYYTRNSSADNTMITVYKPVGDFIIGGGHITPDNSAGVYASTDGFKTNFGFNVKYNKKGNKLKGHMNIIFRRLENDGVHTYQIKANAIQSLGVNVADENNKTAEFISKANLKDITDPLNPVAIGGNLKLKVDLTDRGEPGTDDSIAFNLTKGGTLYYSSNWTGISTAEMQLSGGNLLIHSGFSLGGGGAKGPDVVEDIDDISNLEIKSWPNPSDGYFSIKINTTNNTDKIDIYVFDVTNKLVHQNQFEAEQEYQFGLRLESGVYIVKIYQANKIQFIRLVKY